MYTPKYVKLYELVPESYYNDIEKKGLLSKGFMIFNPLVLETIDMLREKYGPVTINNWKSGGSYQYRGFRPTNSSVGAFLSAHKFGEAMDCNFKNATASEIRKDMEKYGCFKPGFKTNYSKEAECFKYINRIEVYSNGVEITWFHFDMANDYNDDGSIKKVNG